MFSPFIRRQCDSPFVDLSDGMEAFIARRENGRRFMSRYGQVGRKLAREVGPLRFEPNVSDLAIVSTLLDWKADHLRQMRVPNMFQYSWVRNLLEKVCEYNRRDFSPVISVLYAGDRVAAISFAMRTSTVLHGWLQTYNLELAHYSPGTLCCIEIMKVAQSLGIRRFDFGRGPEGYKYRIMSDVTKVAEGTADLRHGTALMRRTWWSARELVRTSPIATPARALAQKVGRGRHWLNVKLANRKKCT
jgi:CelD/BcsL family acetyltransferase involved in cellulose biosynthesis